MHKKLHKNHQPKCRTIRFSIIKNFIILACFMSFAFVVAFFIVGFIQSEIIFQKITNESIYTVEQDLKKIITPVETSLKVVSKLSNIDYFDNLNSQNINHVLIPIFNDFPQIASFRINTEDGPGYVLFKSEIGWMAAKTYSTEDGSMIHWFELNKNMKVAKEHKESVSTRYHNTLWFKKAINSTPNRVIWSEPHRLPFLNTLGITVLLPLKKSDGKSVVFAFDVKLSSFSKVLTKLTQEKQGTPFLITENKKHIILANNYIYESSGVEANSIKDTDEFGLEQYINRGIKNWEEDHHDRQKKLLGHGGKKNLFYYEYQGNDLIGNVKLVSCGSDLSFWMGVILDQDNNIMIKRDSKYLMTIPVTLILALVIALVMAGSMSKKYTLPITKLVERSTQIAKMDLSEGEPIISPIVELQQLADSQETMRVELKNATEKLEEWGNTCSIQVVERTKEVEIKSEELVILNQELAELNQNLEKRVEEEVESSSRKDKIMFQSARQAQMGEMLSMIAHQWRQPLSSISTITGSMLVYLELGTFDEEQFNELLNDINNHAQYLSGTINDFRNFFKPNKDKQPAKLSEVMDQSINIIGKSLDYKSINLNTNYKNVPEILTFPNELMQVFLNIIKNAQDVLLERKTESPSINIDIYEDSENQVVEISDNAGGIPQEFLPKVFEPYFSTKDEKTGTGLGLYMSRLIVEKHCHGDLTVKNAEAGASFKISISTKQEG